MSKAAKRERQRLNREARRQAELAWLKRRKRLKTVRNLGLLLLPLVILFVVLQVVRDDGDGDTETAADTSEAVCEEDLEAPAPKDPGVAGPPPLEIDPAVQYTAVLDTSCGEIEIALDAASAPSVVNNFVALARQGFYDNTPFHRAAEDFVIQGGDPAGDGTGGPGYQIEGEVPAEGTGYEVGTVAMAKGGDDPAGTAGSQFFVVTSEAAAPGEGLDFLNTEPYEFALLGQVISGLEVAQAIEALAPPEGDGSPTQVVVLRSVTIVEAPPAPDAPADPGAEAPPEP